MLPPAEQWCIQIEITNDCNRRCSNCTRCLNHIEKPFFMTEQQFEEAIVALVDFPQKSKPAKSSYLKLIGIFGGEPLLHPLFPKICTILQSYIPIEHRGLWTGLAWEKTKHATIIRETFDIALIHNNRHKTPSYHSPVLVASKDVIKDPTERQSLINNCWLQQRWSSCITPRGFFFCEVAAAISLIFNGPEGLPLIQDSWNHPLSDFQEQIDFCCQRCGICLNLKGRLDTDGIDDISESNLIQLQNSPAVKEKKYYLVDSSILSQIEEPWRYKQ